MHSKQAHPHTQEDNVKHHIDLPGMVRLTASFVVYSILGVLIALVAVKSDTLVGDLVAIVVSTVGLLVLLKWTARRVTLLLPDERSIN